MKKVDSKISKKIVKILNEESEKDKLSRIYIEPVIIAGVDDGSRFEFDNKLDEKSSVKIAKLVNEDGDIVYEIKVYGCNVESYALVKDKETVLKLNKLIK